MPLCDLPPPVEVACPVCEAEPQKPCILPGGQLYWESWCGQRWHWQRYLEAGHEIKRRTWTAPSSWLGDRKAK